MYHLSMKNVFLNKFPFINTRFSLSCIHIIVNKIYVHEHTCKVGKQTEGKYYLYLFSI